MLPIGTLLICHLDLELDELLPCVYSLIGTADEFPSSYTNTSGPGYHIRASDLLGPSQSRPSTALASLGEASLVDAMFAAGRIRSLEALLTNVLLPIYTFWSRSRARNRASRVHWLTRWGCIQISSPVNPIFRGSSSLGAPSKLPQTTLNWPISSH